MTNPDSVNAITLQQHKGTDQAWAKRALPSSDTSIVVSGGSPESRRRKRRRHGSLSRITPPSTSSSVTSSFVPSTSRSAASPSAPDPHGDERNIERQTVLLYTEQIAEIDTSQFDIATADGFYVEYLIQKQEEESHPIESHDEAQYVAFDDDDATTVIPTGPSTFEENGGFQVGIQPAKSHEVDIRSLPNEMTRTWVKPTVRFQYRTTDRRLPSPDEDCLSRT
ncbi:hypothetical protein J7337_008979 [Fusarium musae]|uniref:Uncharacterized protein n=1 Tax=Fusarium musae TaxID=1042133 RepID=A0A9P8DEJ3_9HYPO|nr:hypothetical protein J7337_008979 [Fusarium musae]KAG9500499.1 hypothetical protein J7337_008979 [Fusarium musae]